MAIWFISDTHFGHDNIRRFCERPFGIAHEMNRVMTKNWNKKVAPEDIVYHMGDFASPKDKDPSKFLQRLNGNIILIRGNHDKKQLVEKMPAWCISMSLRLGEFRCLLNHRPLYPKDMQNAKQDPFGDHDGLIEDPQRYDFILSGHIHNNYLDKDGKKIGRLWTGKSLNLSVEIHDYAPVSEEEVVGLLQARHKEYHKGAKNIVPGDYAQWLKVRG